MTIDVTQDDIDHGIQGDCQECPVARALMYAFNLKNRDQVSVPGDNYHDGIVIRFGRRLGDKHYEGEITFPIPDRVSDFITQFDAGNSKLKPFSFKLPDMPGWDR